MPTPWERDLEDTQLLDLPSPGATSDSFSA